MFNWTISTFSEEAISFTFFFENPEYISKDKSVDVMSITFFNTPFYLQPADERLSAIQDGYQIFIELPPQG